MRRRTCVALLGLALAVGRTAASQDLVAAREALDRGDAASCIALLEPSGRLSPEDGELHRLLGHAYAKLGRNDAARAAFAVALAHGQASRDVWLQLAQLTRTLDPVAARTALEQLWILAADPAIGLNLADLERRLGRPDAALAILQTLCVRGQRLPDALARQARIFEDRGEWEAATAALEAASCLRSDPGLLASIADLFERRNDYPRAAQAYERALESAPDDAVDGLRIAAARAHLRTRQTLGARAVLAPVGDPALAAMVSALMAQVEALEGQRESAERHLAQAVAAGWRDLASETHLVDAALESKDWERADALLVRLSIERPDDADLHWRRVRTALGRGQRTQALAALTTLVRLEGRTERVRSGLEIARRLPGAHRPNR